MWQDPIVAEIRAFREAYAERFHYNLEAIGRDVRSQEKQQSDAVFVRVPLKPRRAPAITKQARG